MVQILTVLLAYLFLIRCLGNFINHILRQYHVKKRIPGTFFNFNSECDRLQQDILDHLCLREL